MAEVEQLQTQHDENEKHVSEKAPEANGTTEEHANGTNGTNGDAKPVETAEHNGNGTAHEVTETSVATPEGTPSKPKRSGSRVKDFFSHIFKRKPKEENEANADSPKKEKAKKEKAKKADKNGHKDAATNGESEQPKPADGEAQNGEHAKAEEADALGHKVDDVKIEDSAQAEQVKAVDECHVEKNGSEHLDQNGADEKNGETEQVGGDAEKRNDEKHDC